MPDPFKKLASTLESRFNRIATQAVSGLPAELGVITNAGLKLDSFKHEIPDYLVSEQLQTGLRVGDRVLAVPVNAGNHAVVVCRVVSRGG
ncbi:hypothetical protein [Cohnella sp. REN36]|uniref:hypothetical protein n=1 Tax=Cohnella sp. REN36 TaxID=2887347 RepID=UPI001D14B4BA|nr:hypothetical protein [Cohnella sp. REN36]